MALALIQPHVVRVPAFEQAPLFGPVARRHCAWVRECGDHGSDMVGDIEAAIVGGVAHLLACRAGPVRVERRSVEWSEDGGVMAELR